MFENRLIAFLDRQLETQAALTEPVPNAALLLPLAELPSKEGCTIISASPMASPDVSRRSSMQYSSTPSRSTAATGVSKQQSFGRPLAADSPTSRPLAGAATLAVSSTPASAVGDGTAAKRRRLLDGASSVAAVVEPSPFEPASQADVVEGKSSPAASNDTSRGTAGTVGAGISSRGASFSRQPSGITGGGSFSAGQPTGLPPTGAATPSSTRRNPLLSRLMSAEALTVSCPS